MRTRLLAALALPLVLLFPHPAAADLLVSSLNTNQVLLYDGSTGAPRGAFVPAGSGGLDGPFGLTFGPDGSLYVSSTFSNQVLRYDGSTGEFIDIFASGGGLFLPRGLTFGPDGNLYVSSSDVDQVITDQVLRYNGSTGEFIDVFASGGGGGLLRPQGLTFGPDGNLYVSSSNNNQVRRYDGSTGTFIDVFASSFTLSGPFGLTFGPDGNLYVSNATFDQVQRYNGSTGTPLPLGAFASGGGLDFPTYLTFTPGPVFAVPEPSSLTLLGLGALGLLGYVHRRCRAG